jgi:RES domain-containing protein
MSSAVPVLTRQSTLFTAVAGHFFRAIDPTAVDQALAGSRRAGRYSPPDVPTLYLSSSKEGVEAAMIAHRAARAAELSVVRLDVRAERIFDLRNASACRAAGVKLANALAPWQEIAASGGVPGSWDVRRRLAELGASGLIDPSRKAPGLWHLVLFKWNDTGEASVAIDASGNDLNPLPQG